MPNAHFLEIHAGMYVTGPNLQHYRCSCTVFSTVSSIAR